MMYRSGVHYILKTPKPLESPSHVVSLGPEKFAPRLSRETRARPRPTTSLVSVGLIIPSSQRRAVEYKAVDWFSISACREECWDGSLELQVNEATRLKINFHTLKRWSSLATTELIP